MAFTALATWLDQEPAPVVERAQTSNQAQQADWARAIAVDTPARSPEPKFPPLPAQWPQASFSAAQQDVFGGPAPAPQAAAAPPAASPAPLQESAPPMNYRYLGRFQSPDGKTLVYLSKSDQDTALEIAVGQQLDDGYLIEAIAADEIRLVYPRLNVRASIPIAQAP